MKTIKTTTVENMENAYESVRESGLTNMFDVEEVIRLAQKLKGVVLTKEDVTNMMANYNNWCVRYYSTGEIIETFESEEEAKLFREEFLVQKHKSGEVHNNLIVVSRYSMI